MIPIQDARNIFTKELLVTWNELMELQPKSFLRSFFQTKTSLAKEISIEVVRGTEKIAVDVLRGTNGNRNSFSRSAEKIFVPPFYNEWFDATELDRYDVLYGQGANNVSVPVITGMIDQALEKLNILRYKIERAYELQCAQVFASGIVQLVTGDNVDFKRKAGSMLAKNNAEYWTNPAINPIDDLLTACSFLRQTGKAGDAEFVGIFGMSVLTALLKNPFVKHDDITVVSLVDIKSPQVGAQGGTYHGTLSVGPYKVQLWSYPEYYDNSAGVSTSYVDPDYYFLIPSTTGKFVLSHASVPAIMRDRNNAEFPEFIAQMQADYYINNYIDPIGKKHVFEITSAGLAIPVSIDRIYSSKVTGSDAQPSN